MQTYKLHSINGPVVTVKGRTGLSMMEMVHVGNQRLVGEVIRLDADAATIQVYEETGGLRPGEPVEPTGAPLSVTLGPGILRNIYDGIQRPLPAIEAASGSFIGRGAQAPALDTEKKWDVTVIVKPGDTLEPGQVYATCPETPAVTHRCMLSPLYSRCTVTWVAENGPYTVEEPIAKVKDEAGNEHTLTLCQKWPIRTPRPTAARMTSPKPLITGERVIDTMFPLAKGGAAAIPGGFGTGKTMTQHQLAKWCDADIIIYVGCGERGNEMTQALQEFSELTDPRTGNSLMDRTVLIANTSNMPVAAREASIYTGITLAEYYRDMGYHAAMMADSTSRWAEALREISGRLEEMPADEGYPAYLPSRLAEFYERAGYFKTLCGEEGSVSVIGAVSPQGNDFSEPVTQNTKRFTRCFWALDKSLAYARHYPAINWNDSYSEYLGDLSEWYYDNVGKDFMDCRGRLADLLLQETNLMQIVKLIGSDVLPDDQKLTIEIARVIRVGFLQQNAFHPVDTYVPLEKQLKMMEIILYLYDKCSALVAKQVPVSTLLATGLFDTLVKMKYDIPNDDFSRFDALRAEIDTKLAAAGAGAGSKEGGNA
ncbi:V-type ATP synthase subunit A [Gemmiger formicilis]|uniref:V-type ATP synthase subunit A n=1 Tax=Gemmiger formicilis TaxID=745368 RepID=UPI00195DF513|nr:V-type ATP synthase subunit A [Gemmiger formicilis]MBM6717285.1 V-type ATP synthase subunit A [Gemmiger formicilis]